jgi:hypothetical protein
MFSAEEFPEICADFDSEMEWFVGDEQIGWWIQSTFKRNVSS